MTKENPMKVHNMWPVGLGNTRILTECAQKSLPDNILREVGLVRATSHTRLRARDQYTSSTPIGGEGGAGPSLVHPTLEGPMDYVNARWM
jgi:hypothetical protein